MTIAWMFPGQGSQFVGMGRELYESSPEARMVFDEADQTLGFALSDLCFNGPEAQLTDTAYAQPALLTVSTALVHTLRALGGERLSQPLMVAGHSLGEYSALVAGGALDFATAVRLVRRRGELMAAADEGVMAAVIGLDETTLDQICRETSEQLQRSGELSSTVVIANYNAPDQLVISGSAHAVGLASQRAKGAGAKRVLPLKVSAAFHSPLMMYAAEGMAREIESATIHDPQPPLMANVTAEPISRADDLRRELVSQVVAPVRWIASVQHMAASGIATFVEIGPGKVLTGLVKRIAPQARLVNLTGIDEIHTYLAESR